MKKNLSLLAVVLLSLCLVSVAFDRINPASTVHAASEAGPVEKTSVLSEEEAAASVRSAQPVIFAAAGLVCVLFAVLAVSPLLIEDPEQL